MDFPKLHTVPRAWIFIYCIKTSRKKFNRIKKLTPQMTKKKTIIHLCYIYSYHIFKTVDSINKTKYTKKNRIENIFKNYKYRIWSRELCNHLTSHFIARAIHFVYLYRYTSSIRTSFSSSNNISFLNIPHILPAPIYHMSQKCFHFAKANIFFLQSGIFLSLSMYILSPPPQFSHSFFSTPSRRIGKDDASTSTSSSTALRCLNINPSVEVAGFQLGRRDACGTDTARQKAPTGRLKRSAKKLYLIVRSYVCVSSALSRIDSARIPSNANCQRDKSSQNINRVTDSSSIDYDLRPLQPTNFTSKHRFRK